MHIFEVLLREERQKAYAIGDSHANAVGKNKGFINFSTDGRSAFSQDNIAAIEQVTPGSVVVLSAGANDTTRTNIGSTIQRIEKMLNMLLNKDCDVYFILMANSDSPAYGYRGNQLRQELSRQIPEGVHVIDMGSLSVKNGDGIHAPAGWYNSVASKVLSYAKDLPPPKEQPRPNAERPAQAPQAEKPAGKPTPGATPPAPGREDKTSKPAETPSTTPAPTRSTSTPAPETKKEKPTAKVDTSIKNNPVAVGDVAAYLKSKGLDSNQIAGILNNIYHESSPPFNSASLNPDDKGARSIGFFQHRGSRDRALEKAVPDWRTNWKGQIDFALSEPAGVEYQSLQFKHPEQASAWWTKNFEVPEHPKIKAITRLRSINKFTGY